jgi:hypothetical protein
MSIEYSQINNSKGSKRKAVSLYLDNDIRVHLAKIQSHTGIPFQPLVRIALTGFINDFYAEKQLKIASSQPIDLSGIIE